MYYKKTFDETTGYAYGRIMNHSLPQNTHNPFNMHKIMKHKTWNFKYL